MVKHGGGGGKGAHVDGPGPNATQVTNPEIGETRWCVSRAVAKKLWREWEGRVVDDLTGSGDWDDGVTDPEDLRTLAEINRKTNTPQTLVKASEYE